MGYSYSIKLNKNINRELFQKLFYEFFDAGHFPVGNVGSSTSYGPKNNIGFDYSCLATEDRIPLEILFAKLCKNGFGQVYYDEMVTEFVDYTEEKGDVLSKILNVTSIKSKTKLVLDFLAKLEQCKFDKVKNLLGEEVEPRRLTFKREGIHLTIFNNGKFLDVVSPNGWTGYGSINAQKGEPVLTNSNLWFSISLSEMKQIIEAWEAN